MNRINRWMYGWRQRKVGNVLFNNEFNTVIYGYMAKRHGKGHSDSETYCHDYMGYSSI